MIRHLLIVFPLVLQCLASPFSGQTPLTGSVSYPGFSLDLNERRLIQLEGEPPVWMTELEKIRMKAAGLNFFDITDAQDLEGSAPFRIASADPYSLASVPAFKGRVDKALSHLSMESMEGHLRKLTSFRTRYYRSSTGKESQEWLLQTISAITDEYAPSSLRSNIIISEFPHSWGQNTIISRIEGQNDEPIVIISAHQDSTNLIPFLPAPGADDDGSGTVTILEAYKALLSEGFTPNRTIEFHWYSAEEGGLLGSQAVAKDYAAKGVEVHAMMQMDMTAFVKKGTEEIIGIGADPGIDTNLIAFHKKVIESYCDLPWKETKCGYACSDHGSWGKAGYPNSFTTESLFEDSNKNIHSMNDVIDIDEFHFDHMLQLAKLATAYSAEAAGWA